LKICTKCKVEKPISEFGKKTGCKGGLNPACKSCLASYAQAYNLRTREQRCAQKREYYKENSDDWVKRRVENSEKIKAYSKAYRAINKDRFNAWRREWKAINKEKVAKYYSEYHSKNPKYRDLGNRRRRAKLAAAEGNHTANDVDLIFSRQSGKCASCNKKLNKSGDQKFHVDHIIPLANGGSNWPSNLQCLCPSCNLRKSAKDPFDWAKENGKLL